MNYEHTHVSISDGSPAMQRGPELDGKIVLVNEDGISWVAPTDEWIAIQTIENLRENDSYRLAESFLDGSPGAPEYVRGLSNIVAAFEGLELDEVLAALTAYNNAQEA